MSVMTQKGSDTEYMSDRLENRIKKTYSVYEIAKSEKDGKSYYYLRRRDTKGQELPVVIKPEDLNTLILYKVN